MNNNQNGGFPGNNKNCAENFPRWHWPEKRDKSEFIRKSYNVIVYQFDDCYASFTEDARGMSGHGDTIDEALRFLKILMEGAVTDVDSTGGVYPDASTFEHQIESLKKLEEEWNKDGVQIIGKTYHVLKIFDK